MSERSFRLIQGLYILLVLYFELDTLLYVYLGIIALEGITNWRLPTLINRLRYGSPSPQEHETKPPRFNFEAERLLRLVVFTLLLFTVLIFPEAGWFFPWFIGAMLFMAGVTNICPMVMMFRYLGFR
jgi:hypothetical protein